MAFISYTERPISALGSAWEAGTRLIWSKPFIIGPEYSPIRWTAFWNRAHQKHAHPSACLWDRIMINAAFSFTRNKPLKKSVTGPRSEQLAKIKYTYQNVESSVHVCLWKSLSTQYYLHRLGIHVKWFLGKSAPEL